MTLPARDAPPSLDEIVARVLSEAARRGERATQAAARPGWESIAGRAGLGAAAAASATAPAPAFPIRPDRTYDVGDFLALHGGTFVTACYRGVLGRDPDAAGHRHHLRMLLEGAPRAEVLARLRYSAEGRAYGARVAGLAARAFVAALGRIPLAGPVLEWLLALAMAGRNARALRALEARRALDAERGGRP